MKPPIYSRCSIGKNKWYWMIKEEIWSEDILSEGVEATPEACLLAASKFGEVYPVQCSFAEYHRRKTKAEQKMKTEERADSADAQLPEYVYECHLSFSDYGDDHPSITRHRIVKKSKTRLYVACDGDLLDSDGNIRWSAGRNWSDWEKYSIKTFVLDRKEFEANGMVERRPRYACDSHTDFYKSAEMYLERYRSQQLQTEMLPAEVRETFDLPDNATKEDVKKAFKRMARECHPDLGGDPEEFKRIRNVYEMIL